jgi:carbon storage regulator CsrA
MLVLSRRVNEKIVLPSLGVTLVVLEVQGKKVRLGISAPADIKIARQEVWHDFTSAPERPAGLSDSQIGLSSMTGI